MNTKQEIEFLKDLDWTQTKNSLKEIWSDIRFKIVFFVFLVPVFVILISAIVIMVIYAEPGAYEDSLNVFSGFFLFLFTGIMAVMLGTTGLRFTRAEIEFLIPRPISVKSLVQRKIIRGYYTCTILILVGLVLTLGFFRINYFLDFYDYIRIIYGCFTFSFVMVGIFPLVYNLINKLQIKFKKVISKLLGILFFICLIELYYFILTIPIFEHASDYIRELLGIFPLNILLIYPISAVYIITAETYDIYFWLAVLLNGVLFVTVFYLSLRNDFQNILKTSRPADAVGPYDAETPAKPKWWRRGPLKDIRYDYPRIKPGEGAVMEIGFLKISRQGTFMGMFSIIFLVGMSMVLSIFMGNESINFPFLFLMAIFFISFFALLSSSYVGPGGIYNYFQLLPFDGKKLAAYKVIPTLAVYLIIYYGWLCFNIIIGILTDIEVIAIAVWFGGSIIIAFISILELSTKIFSVVDELTIGISWQTLIGIMGLFFMFLALNGASYVYISDYITSAWKFFVLGLINLVFAMGLILIYGYDFDNATKKKQRFARLAVVLVLLLVLANAARGFPIYKFTEISSDVPDSWELWVDDEMIIEDQVKTFNDYIYIQPTGMLTIKNSSIIFDCTNDYKFGLYLSDGGWLRIENSTITSAKRNYGFICKLYGGANITGSTLEDLWAAGGLIITGGGVEVYSDDVTMIDCLILNSRCDGITCDGGMVRVINSTIEDNKGDGIDLEDSYAIILNCLIYNNNDDGVDIEDSDVVIENCTIKNNDGYGINNDGSELILVNNTYKNNNEGSIDE
ncbi:right-handed parallel beta-helix repeat-containing protein [[Eubacterium] cellulosolvens]